MNRPDSANHPAGPADSGGTRSRSGSNYGDWRPARPDGLAIDPATAPAGVVDTPGRPAAPDAGTPSPAAAAPPALPAAAPAPPRGPGRRP